MENNEIHLDSSNSDKENSLPFLFNKIILNYEIIDKLYYEDELSLEIRAKTGVSCLELQN